MKHLSEDFAARLAAEAASLCLCWRFERSDGAAFGATDHDAAVVFGGLTHEPARGLGGGVFETGAGLAPGQAGADGALDADFITEADMAAGLWDGARVDVWRVDWRAPEHGVRIWSGALSEVSRRGETFAAELVSLKAGLERVIGRVYSRACDAEVGDARCGVDLTAAAYRCEGEAGEVPGAARFRADELAAFDAGWFAGGRLAWTTGANAGSSQRVARHAGDEVELSPPPRFAIAPGDAFSVTAGCDKSFAACGAKFANRVNFRGFPHLPGMDAVLAGPASGRVHDGGRRR